MYLNTAAISSNPNLLEAKKEETINLYTALLINIYNIQNRELKISLAVMTAKIIINLSNQELCPLDKKLISLANKLMQIVNTPFIASKDPLENHLHNDSRTISIWVGNSDSNSDLFSEFFHCILSCISDPNEQFYLTAITAKIIKNFPEKLDITVTNLAETVLNSLQSYSNMESSCANTKIPASSAIADVITSSSVVTEVSRSTEILNEEVIKAGETNNDLAIHQKVATKRGQTKKTTPKGPSPKKQRLKFILDMLKSLKLSTEPGKNMKYEQITKGTNCSAKQLHTIFHNYFDSEGNYHIGSKEWSPDDERRLHKEYNKLKETKEADDSAIFPTLATIFQTNPMNIKRTLRKFIANKQ